MTQLDPVNRGIGEEEVAASAPMVRALLVQRLEQIWNQCQPHVDGSVKPDPRFIEAGIRVLDRLAKLYRLDQISAANDANDADPVAVARSAALKQLDDLESRMRES